MSNEAELRFGADSPAQGIQSATSPASDMTLWIQGEQATEQADRAENIGGQSGGHSARLRAGNEKESDRFGGGRKSGGQGAVVNETQDRRAAPLELAVKDQETGGQSPQTLSLPGACAASLSPASGGQFPQSGGQEVVVINREDKRKASESGGQGAQVIPLAANHHKSRPLAPGSVKADNSSPVDESPDGQNVQWLKTILPNVPDGWWEVRAEGQGVSLKFRWRDQVRQTLTFPRLTGNESRNLKDAGYEEACRMIRERIAGHLRGLSLDPAKGDKARLVAEKLEIDLDSSVNIVNILMANEI